eukprot:4330602-Prorocentrum_lima.AAC.1
MTSSLVGSEMCIRDRIRPPTQHIHNRRTNDRETRPGTQHITADNIWICLLYTSDAATICSV